MGHPVLDLGFESVLWIRLWFRIGYFGFGSGIESSALVDTDYREHASAASAVNTDSRKRQADSSRQRLTVRRVRLIKTPGYVQCAEYQPRLIQLLYGYYLETSRYEGNCLNLVELV